MDCLARGETGIVMFDGATVTILRRGMSLLATGPKEKRIGLSTIATVQIRPAGLLISGFIRFAPIGEADSRPRTDEHSVVFSRSQATAFMDLGRAVEEAMTPELHRQGDRVALAPVVSVADELTKLARLVEQELLTRDEFDTEKARLLRR
jgi:hypothetical protein